MKCVRALTVDGRSDEDEVVLLLLRKVQFEKCVEAVWTGKKVVSLICGQNVFSAGDLEMGVKPPEAFVMTRKALAACRFPDLVSAPSGARAN